MALRPRYVQERVDYLSVEGLSTLTFPMTCFCDIPLSKAGKHMHTYGRYGLALNKNCCLRRDIQPVTYLNTSARLTRDLSSCIRQLMESRERVDERWGFLPDMLMGLLLYSKPVSGVMWRESGTIENQLFIDEYEWRYIPEIPDGMTLTMDPGDSTTKGRAAYSQALAKHQNTWFRFAVDGIEHIIVPNETEAIELMHAIDLLDDRDCNERHRLMTKIEAADKIRLNFV